MNRTGDFINTYTGIRFYPLDPRAEEIDILDIAHALSFMVRANGHLESFYTVGQHCLNCAGEAIARGYSLRICLACLLHDGSEAYLSDITRPVKQYLQTYRRLERKIQSTVYAAFRLGELSPEEQAKVDEIDNDMLYYEFARLHPNATVGKDPNPLLSEADFSEKKPAETEKTFLSLFEELRQNL